MRKILLILVCILSLIGCKKKEYTLDDLDKKEELYYIKGTNDLYSGETIERYGERITAINVFEKGDHIKGTTFYPNGNKEYEIESKNGKENGYWRQYFYNGQLDYETFKKDGIINGETKSYYENGQLKYDYDTLQNGVYYYEDGKVLMKKEKDGVEIYYDKEGKEISYEEIKQVLENQ